MALPEQLKIPCSARQGDELVLTPRDGSAVERWPIAEVAIAPAGAAAAAHVALDAEGVRQLRNWCDEVLAP